MRNQKSVSVIVPCKNEYNYIERFLESLIEQDFNKSKMEIIIIDGNSSDGTRGIIKKFIKKYNYISLLTNKNGIIPVSLNMGLKKTKGDIIIRMDVHSLYPENYISRLIYWQNYLKADNVGAKWDIISNNNSKKSHAIAIACGIPISVGNVSYKLGTDKPKEVDTVPYGCYKKEIFQNIGLFNEELFINQDDEFNFRLKKTGGKIFLIPDIVIKYFARENFNKLFLQYFKYGYEKPIILKRYKSLPKLRHFVPVSFVLFLFSYPLSFIFNSYNYIYFFIFSCYLLLLNLFSLKEIIKRKVKIKIIFYLIWSIFLIHFSYGLGFLKGVIDFIIFNKKIKVKES